MLPPARRIGLLPICLAAALALAPIACGSAAADAGAGKQAAQQLPQRPTDIALRRDVLRALARIPSIDYRALKVHVAQGIVTLRGTVPTMNDRARAERITEAVPGVRLVVNQLKVAGPVIRKLTY